jgi:hypothetical protein
LWKLDEKGDARVGGDRETAAERLYAFPHTAETIAFVELWLGAIIADEQRMVTVPGGVETDAAVRGPGVTDDIGYRFTNGETEDGFFGCM